MMIRSFIFFLLVTTGLWWNEAFCFTPCKGIHHPVEPKMTSRNLAMRMVVSPDPPSHHHHSSLQHDVLLAATATALALAVSFGNPKPLLHGDISMMRPHHPIHSSTQIVSPQPQTMLRGEFDPYVGARQILRTPPLSFDEHDASLPHQGLSHGLRARLQAQQQFQKHDPVAYSRNGKTLQTKLKFSQEQKLQQLMPQTTTMPTFET